VRGARASLPGATLGEPRGARGEGRVGG
jgi:hypothetical protein